MRTTDVQLRRRGVAGASCIIFARRAAAALLGVAAAAPYLGDVDAGLTPRKHAAAYFCRNHQHADFRKSLALDQLVWKLVYGFYAYRWSEFA